MSLTVIGLVGGAGVGKDTCASYLSQKLGAPVYALASSLRRFTSRLYGIPPHFLVDHDLKDRVFYPLNKTPRELMCTVGDAMLETYGDEYLVRVVGQWLELDQEAGHTTAVVSDVRYAHEARAMREWTGSRGMRVVLVKVIRSSVTLSSPHRSELDWPQIDCDYAVYNDYNLQYLHGQLDMFVQSMQPKCQ